MGNVKKACKTDKGKKGRYVCADCAKTGSDAGDICRPKEIPAAFVCKKCGSSSLMKKQLCKPKPVRA